MRRIISLAATGVILAIAAIGAAPAVAVVDTFSSQSFAGYQQPEGGVGCCTVGARFKVPQVSGCGAAERAIRADVGVYKSSKFSSAGMFVGCKNGKAHYWPSLVLNGNQTNYPAAKAHPGDAIKLHVSQTSSKTSVSVVNETRNITRSASGAGSFGGQSPWIGDDGWFVNGNLLRVPNFGTLTFRHCLLNGHPFGSNSSSSSSSIIDRYNRVTSGGTLQIKTGPFSGGNEVFDTVFKHS
jgi:Peptidase A4 family